MMKSILRKSSAVYRFLTRNQSFSYGVAQPRKTLPRIISESKSVDEFQYFSMKIKDLMDKEQLEYFENVVRKVENINHPVAELMR
jgi:hypothetical protein